LREAATISKTGKSVDARVHIQGFFNFEMHSSTVKAGEHHTVALNRPSQDYHGQWTEKVNSDVSKSGKMRFETTSWKWTHKWWH
jgi:hypothetical protein